METCPSFIPPVWLRQPPPFGKGGFGLRIHYLRSNDTGRVRERTIRRKPSCEIDSGGTPPGRDSGQFSVGKLRGSALLVGAKRMEPFIGAFGLRGPPEGTRGNFPLENCEVRRFWLVRNGWSRLLGLLGYGGRRKGLVAICLWQIVRFGAVQPAPPTVHRTVGFYLSSPFPAIKNPDTRWVSGFFGTPEGTRTPDLLIRSQSLYPTELPAHGALT